jgi:hypothetical protein
MPANEQTPGLIPTLRRLYAAKVDVAVASDAKGGFTVGISKKPGPLAAIRHFASKELGLISEWLEGKACDLYQLDHLPDVVAQPTAPPERVRWITDDPVSDAKHLKLARKCVAEAEARVAAQRERVSKLAAAGHNRPEAWNLLLVFEKTLGAMRAHLAFVESKSVKRRASPAGEAGIFWPA